MTESSRKLLALIPVAMLGGCAIAELHQDIDVRETRIQAKREELGALQTTQAEIRERSRRLQSDLQRSEIDAGMLRQRLMELLKINNGLRGLNRRDEQAQEARRLELESLTEQLQALELDGHMDHEHKRAKLTALKERTRQVLQLLLVG